MMTRTLSLQNERLCTRAGAKRGDGGYTVGTTGTSTTGRIHIRVSHETLVYLADYEDWSGTQLLQVLMFSPNVIAFSRNLRSILKCHASLHDRMGGFVGRLANSSQRCGIQKYVSCGRLTLHFVCAEHGCTHENQS